jgi:hypothetical protein
MEEGKKKKKTERTCGAADGLLFVVETGAPLS